MRHRGDKPTAARNHIVLTSHGRRGRRGADNRVPLQWGAPGAQTRGPIVATQTDSDLRNAIGSHGGAYSLYRALAVTAGRLDPMHVPDYTNTHPAAAIGPHAQWADADKVVSLDPYGHLVGDAFADAIADGLDVRPTIAVTEAHLKIPRNPPGHVGRRSGGRRPNPHGDGRRTRHQGRHRPGLAPARHRPPVRRRREPVAPASVRTYRRHVPGTGHPPRHRGFHSADRRPKCLHRR